MDRYTRRARGRSTDERDPIERREEPTFGETLTPTQSIRPVMYERVVTQRDTYYGWANSVYGLLGLVEAALLLRLMFELLGANSGNTFVSFIYALTYPLVVPFYGIFGNVDTGTALALFDSATLIAMILYAVIAWAIVRLIAAVDNRPADRL